METEEIKKVTDISELVIGEQYFIRSKNKDRSHLGTVTICKKEGFYVNTGLPYWAYLDTAATLLVYEVYGPLPTDKAWSIPTDPVVNYVKEDKSSEIREFTGKHSPLPWRITGPEEKKGREIVDARGNTVAKLTILDLDNGKVIIKGVNLMHRNNQEIRHITNADELEVGREYWLLPKVAPQIPYVATCDSEFGRKYFGARIWADMHNNQAMQRWDIFGPLPVLAPPDFDALKAVSIKKKTT